MNAVSAPIESTVPATRAPGSSGASARADVDAVITRQRGHDRDLWVIEIEDRAGRTLLDEDGLG